MRFAPGTQQGRVSVTSTVLPIWVAYAFKPLRARLIEGEAELLLGKYIVSKLDIRVEFGSKLFRVGRGELRMMTFNEKHRWVSPLPPTACDCAKLDDYFGKMKNRTSRPFMWWGFLESFGSSECAQNPKSTAGEQNVEI